MNDEKKRKSIKYVLIAAIIALMAFAVAISAQNTADTALQPPPVPCTNTTFLQSFSGNTTVCNTVPLSGTLTFFFDNQTSVNTVNASKRMLPAPNSTEFIQTHTNLPNNGSIQNWTTRQGTPNLSFIPAGDFTVHIHASSNHDNMVMIYAQIWEVNNTGVYLNLIGQTEHEMLTTTETQFNMIFVSPNTYFFNTTSSRIMVQIFTHVLADNPDATLYFGGEADSKLSLPSNTVDASNFVPYTNGTRDLDLRPFNITAANINGNITDTDVSQSYWREFWQKQGSVAQGTWAWLSAASQTDYSSVTGEGAGIWDNTASHANGDEYNWNGIYLAQGTYNITLSYLTATNRGIAEFLIGTTSLGTVDMYENPNVYNRVHEFTFTITTPQTADFRFKVSGKNASSSNFLIGFSRLFVEKVG